MKQLLAICWEMPPLSGPRAVQVTRLLGGLVDCGWQSRVICFGPTSHRYQQDNPVSLEDASEGNVVRIPVASPEEWLAIRALWRIVPPLKHVPDEKIVWMPFALAEARRALADRPADAIVSFAQPWTDHLIGLRLHRETGVPWVAHFSDPWTDSPYQPASGWFTARRQRMEAAVIGEADATVFVNAFARDRVMRKYASAASRSEVIPQAHVAATAVPATTDGPLRIVYTGRFYDGVRTPETFIAAVAELKRRRPMVGAITVDFVGSNMEAYAQQAEQHGVNDVIRFLGRRSPESSRNLASEADVLLVIDAPSTGPSLFLPSKLIDYLPIRRVILGITPLEGPTADVLGQLNYPVADPHDVNGIASLLSTLIDQKSAGTLHASGNHDEVAAGYSVSATAGRMDRVLRSVIRLPR